jgi:alkylhydroperoxidase family enzyme
MTDQGNDRSLAPDVLDAIAAREAAILGEPPRIAPVDRESAAAAEVIAATARLRADLMGDNKPLAIGAIPEIMFTLCRYPDIWGKVMALSLQVQGPSATLPAHLRQLAILRTAWLLQAPYEWGEHVRHSKRLGITSEQIDRITRGSVCPEWSEEERAILKAAEELRDNAMLTEDTWHALAAVLNDEQSFELLVLIGHFTNVAYMQNTLRLRLEPSNPGLRAR